MKKIHVLFVLLLISAAFLLASCTTTTVMTDVWKDKTYQGKPQKIVVIMAAKSQDRRNLFEDRFSAELDARGNNSFQSYTIIPMEQLPDKEMVKSKIKSSGADTVLISRLVDTKEIESYRPEQREVYGIVFADYGYNFLHDKRCPDGFCHKIIFAQKTYFNKLFKE